MKPCEISCTEANLGTRGIEERKCWLCERRRWIVWIGTVRRSEETGIPCSSLSFSPCLSALAINNTQNYFQGAKIECILECCLKMKKDLWFHTIPAESISGLCSVIKVLRAMIYYLLPGISVWHKYFIAGNVCLYQTWWEKKSILDRKNYIKDGGQRLFKFYYSVYKNAPTVKSSPERM